MKGGSNVIVANLATYPPRVEGMLDMVQWISPQVDQLNVVLNEYTEIPKSLAKYHNVEPVIPTENTMDAGKFYVDSRHAKYVLYIDDDIYPPNDFVARTVDRYEALGTGRWLAGYHGSIYRRPLPSFNPRKLVRYLAFTKRRIASYREVVSVGQQVARPFRVDQIATNCAIIEGNLAPAYQFMRSSRRFVDVRLARWSSENGISSVCLPREQGWMKIGRFDQSIHQSFTKKNLPHVADEIWRFAFSPDAGKEIHDVAASDPIVIAGHRERKE